MKKIKILVFLPNLSGGGAEKVTINILRILDKNIFDVHLAVINKNGPALDYLPQNITLYDLNVSKTIFSINKLRKLIKRIKPDTVYSTLIRSHSALYLALKFVKIKPLVVLRSPNSPKLLLGNKQLNPIRKLLLECAYRNADLVLAQTPEMKDEIVKFHHIDRKKIQVLLNPLDIDTINQKINNIKTPFDISYINVVAAGRLTRQKGFDILIKSFKNIIVKNNNFRLYIIGEDDGEKEILLELVREQKIEKYINFLGYQKNPYKYYFFSDLYVLSSRWEGLPNTVLENLYLNKPVIATRCIPYMDTLIEDGKNGLLVDVENVEQLSNAILNYKSIQMNFTKTEKNKSEINDLFINLKKDI